MEATQKIEIKLDNSQIAVLAQIQETSKINEIPKPVEKTIAVTETQDNKPAQPTKFKVYKYRWAVLIAFCLIKYSSCATYSLFLPFSSYISEIYGIDHFYIVLSSYTFNGLYPLASFFIADPVIQSKGIKFSVI
jgi:hypothetical protein